MLTISMNITGAPFELAQVLNAIGSIPSESVTQSTTPVVALPVQDKKNNKKVVEAKPEVVADPIPTNQPEAQAVAEPQPAAVKNEPAQAVEADQTKLTQEHVRAQFVKAVQVNRDACVSLLAKYGAAKIGEVSKSDYPQFLADLNPYISKAA